MILAAGSTLAQNAGQSSPGFGRQEEEKPRSFQEALEKRRIARSKKDHEQMISRGEEAVKLSADLERAVAINGSLGERDLAKVVEVEKLVRKIRDELGGNGEGDIDDPTADALERVPSTQQGLVEALKTRAESMHQQIKNTTRFTVSASAIDATNSVLRIARFLKLTR